VLGSAFPLFATSLSRCCVVRWYCACRLLHKSDTSGSRSFRDLLLTFTLPSPRRAQPECGSATHVLSPSHAAVRNAAAEDYAWTQVRCLDVVAVLYRTVPCPAVHVLLPS
jgi:hypothetical protein